MWLWYICGEFIEVHEECHKCCCVDHYYYKVVKPQQIVTSPRLTISLQLMFKGNWLIICDFCHTALQMINLFKSIRLIIE